MKKNYLTDRGQPCTVLSQCKSVPSHCSVQPASVLAGAAACPAQRAAACTRPACRANKAALCSHFEPRLPAGAPEQGCTVASCIQSTDNHQRDRGPNDADWGPGLADRGSSLCRGPIRCVLSPLPLPPATWALGPTNVTLERFLSRLALSPLLHTNTWLSIPLDTI